MADVDNARSRASSNVSSFVGVEIARDFGRAFLGEWTEKKGNTVVILSSDLIYKQCQIGRAILKMYHVSSDLAYDLWFNYPTLP